MYLFIGNARKKDKYKRMKQQEAKKELKKKGIGGGGKAGGKVTPFTGTAQTVGKQQLGTIMNSSLFFLYFPDALSTTEQGGQQMGSSSSLRSQNYLENVIQWEIVVRRYRDLKEAPKDLLEE